MKKEVDTKTVAATEEVVADNVKKAAPIQSEGVLARLSVPITMKNAKEYELLKAAMAFANCVNADIRFADSGIACLDLELFRITN